MITSALAILLVVGATFAVMVGVALLVKIWNINPDEFAEVRRVQGGLGNLFSGSLRNPPDEHGDFRIVRGLKWDRKSGEYKPQSALSSEGFRAAFPK